MNAMNRLFTAICIYLGLGLASGLAFREITKHSDWPATDHTQMSVVHTHLLTLGVIVLLAVLALEAVLRLSDSPRLFGWFQVVYHAGVLVSSVMMFVRGMLTIQGTELGDMDAMISGIAGLGHVFLTVGFILLMVLLRKAIVRRGQQSGADVEADTAAGSESIAAGER